MHPDGDVPTAMLSSDHPETSERASGVPCHGQDSEPSESGEAVDKQRLTAMIERHYAIVWRTLRRLLPEDAVQDGVQQVFWVTSRKLSGIEPERERAFLLRTACNVGAHLRRTFARRRETMTSDIDEFHTDNSEPEELTQERERRRLLAEILDAMDDQLRHVFVLFELEELSMIEIAAALEIPMGTVASRLRRAREEFHANAKRLRARDAFERRSR